MLLSFKREVPQDNNNANVTGAPSVDFLNTEVAAEAPKSTIGVRKIQPKRGVSKICLNLDALSKF